MRLDDELSPMEEELLERHLEARDGCSAFEKDVGWATDVVRLTASERSTRRVRMSVPSRGAARWGCDGPPRQPLQHSRSVLLVGIAGQGSSSAEPTPPSQVSLVDDFGGKGYPRAKIRVPAAPPLQPPPKGVI